MSAPVWVLSVDLQTKTATFQSGMAEAAKSARGAFNDIKSGARTMGSEVGSSAMSARQGVMLLGDEFGVHLPRGLTMFISSLGPVGAAMEAAFPFIAIALGASLLLEHFAKLKAEGRELTDGQVKFGNAAQNAFNSLDEKMLQAQKRAAELRNDHLGALHKELELIDKQSMAELVQQFGVVAKAADEVFTHLDKKWYEFGAGSTGAKSALMEFGLQYEALMAKGKSGDASALLAGTKAQAEHVLDMQKQLSSTDRSQNPNGLSSAQDTQRIQALNELKKYGAGLDKSALDSQQAIVNALNAQAGIEERVAALKKQDGDNAKTSTAKEGSAQASAAAKAAADSQLRIAQSLLQGERASADARLTVTRASIAERESVELAFAQRELDIARNGNKAQMAALDKMASDYPNALKALNEKTEELTAQHNAKVAEITAKAQTEQNAKNLADIETGIRAAIAGTQEGTAARLAAIDAGLKTEAAANMQDLSAYRDLQTQRVQVLRQMTDEGDKLKSESGREAADNDMKMGMLGIAAAKEQQALFDSLRHISAQQRVDEETAVAAAEFKIKSEAAQRDIDNLNKGEKDYLVKLQTSLDKQQQLIREHANEVAAIKSQSEAAQNQKSLSSMTQLQGLFASGFTEVLMGHKSFAAAMDAIGGQVVSGMLRNALMSMMAADMDKERQAASAARAMFLAGTKMPFPTNIVAAPALGAMAFASVMAFQDGTDSVPGVGRGDRVPAMLEPGEGVVPGGVMDGLRSMARSGTMGGGSHYHLHTRVTLNASALDGDGMDEVLKKHGDKLEKHFQNAVRKMNR